MKKILLLSIVLTFFVVVLTKYDISNFNDLFDFISSSKVEKTKKEKVEKVKVQKRKVKKINKQAQDYFAIGNAKIKSKDYNGAILDFTKAIKENPEYVEAYRARALAKDAINDFVGAKEDYEKVIFFESGQNDLLNEEKYNNMMDIVNKGNNLFKEQKYQDAIVEYNTAIKSYPGFSEPYIRKADTNFMLKNYEDALQNYTNALKNDTNNYSVYMKRANTKYMLQDYKSAIEDYNVYLKYKPKNAKIYYKIAGAYIFLEDFENAYINLNNYDCLTETKTIKSDDYRAWNAILDKYTTNEYIRDIKYILKNLEIVK